LPQAVAELGRAIAENATLPALYRYRHELRAMLHQVAEFSRDDPDHSRYSDLCNNGYYPYRLLLAGETFLQRWFKQCYNLNYLSFSTYLIQL
jgi:hypothetical protein